MLKYLFLIFFISCIIDKANAQNTEFLKEMKCADCTRFHDKCKILEDAEGFRCEDPSDNALIAFAPGQNKSLEHLSDCMLRGYIFERGCK